VAAALRQGLQALVLPAPLTDGSQGAERAARMRELVRERLEEFA
jgi:serine/threonine-protein kinase HipA